MTLAEYIAKVGDEEFAKLFDVTPRAAMSWRLGDRLPRKETAKRIVQRTPVTWAGIYAQPPKEGRAA
jgi:hypothetical protein